MCRGVLVFACVAVIQVLTGVSPAVAQSTYVSASLLGEFSRFSGFEVDDGPVPASVVGESPNGKTLGFNLRVGRGLTARWGVEFEFARGGVDEQDESQRVFPLLTELTSFVPGLPGVIRSLPINPILPPDIALTLENEREHMTLATTAWVRQAVSDRVDLVFTGGVSFNRIETEQNVRLTDQRLAIYFPFPQAVETVEYDVGPVVGAETVIDVGEHAALTGGVRLHAVRDGWLIRPAVGLRWTF